MRIRLYKTPIQKIFQYDKTEQRCCGYIDNGIGGVFGMNGKLDIRPEYQREFVYDDTKRAAVINTIKNKFPLNLFYFIVNKTTKKYEVLDGQQRLISIGQYISNVFSFNNLFFSNLPENEQDQILNYSLMTYMCFGTNSERLNWFKTINIVGEKLTNQEIRNAIYAGPWLSDAKRHFSKPNCPAYNIGKCYLTGVPIRQDYLQTVIRWISNGKIENYMGQHQHDKNAKDLWNYFVNVLDWTKYIFPKYRKEMQGVPFGFLYNEYSKNSYDPNVIEKVVSLLMEDEDVTKKSGIYIYIFDRNERHLNIRSFELRHKREAYERQKGICIKCQKHFDINEMEADHITPWSQGGKTIPSNCQMLCKDCNRIKSNI
jgi:hypothetical protein